MSISKRNDTLMMKRWLIYILLFVVLVLPQAVCSMPHGLFSPVDTVGVDSVQNEKESAVKQKYKAENKGFDARNYAFQKRYRIPPATPRFNNSNFFSHMYIGVSGGIEHMNRRGKYNYKTGSSYSFFIGKDVAKDHSISLAVNIGSNDIKNSDIELRKRGVQLNYHFHLTRYFLGYNPNRILDVSTTLGVGYQRSEVWRNVTNSAFGMIGLRSLVRLSNRMHLAIDPYMLFASAGYNGMHKDETAFNYNTSYGVAMSLIYTLKNELSGNSPNQAKSPDENPMFDRNYIFVEGGTQSIYSDIRFSESFGRYFALGYGYWFARHLALQFSGGYSSGNWDKFITPANLSAGTPQYEYMSKVQYFFARAELVGNLLTLPLKAKDSDKKFFLGASVGYEYGFQWKYTETARQTSCYYGGLTGALQAKWLLPDGKALYLSPRVTFVNFGVPYKVPYEYIEKDYTDKRFNLALGLEFGLKRRPYVKRSGDDEKFVYKENGKLKFRQALSVSTSFGSNYIMERGRFKNVATFNVNGAFAFEYQPIAYVGVRLKTDFTTHNFHDVYDYAEKLDGKTYKYKGLWHIKFKVINGMFDVKLDISNMIHGYDPYRKWDVAFYAGPLLSKHLPFETEISEDELTLPGSTISVSRSYPKDLLWGVHGAFNCKYSITRRWGVFGEFGVKIHKNNYLWSPYVDYNPLRVLDLEFGINFKIR